MQAVKRKLCAILCAALLVGALTPTANAAAPTFSDVPNNFWGASYIQKCAGLGIVSGVGGGKFNPNGTVTFAEFSKMLTNALFPETVKRCEADTNAAGKPWYWVYMQAAYNSTLFSGTPVKFSGGWNTGGAGGYLQFLPDNDIDTWANVNMTRYYMAEMTFDALNYHTSGIYDPNIGEEIPGMDFSLYTSTYMSKLKDSGTIPEEHKAAITACMYAGIINGMDGSFVGNQTMTRAEACKVLLTLMEAIDRVKPDRTLDPSEASAPSTPTTTTTPSRISDVSGHKYAEAINALWDGSIITAEDLDANGNFRPDDELRCSEQALMYIRMFNNIKPVNKLEDEFDYMVYTTKIDGKWVDVDLTYLLDTPAGAAAYGLSKYITGYLGSLRDIDKTDGPLTVQSMRSEVHDIVYYVTNTAPDAKWKPAYHGYGVPVTEFYGECGAYDTNLDKVRFTEQRDENNRVVREWGDQPVTRGEWAQIIYNLGITKAGQLTALPETGGAISG